MIGNTDRDDPSTWNDTQRLLDDLVEDIEGVEQYSSSGAWLVRPRLSDDACIVYKAVEVRYD